MRTSSTKVTTPVANDVAMRDRTITRRSLALDGNEISRRSSSLVDRRIVSASIA